MERTKSQIISKMIPPISSTIVHLEDSPILTKILLGELEEQKETIPPTNHVMQLTLNEIETTGDESLEWKRVLKDKIDKEEYVEINEHDLEKQLHNL
jgi:hypothetical protein